MKFRIRLLIIVTIAVVSFAQSTNGAERVSYLKKTTNGNGVHINNQNKTAFESASKNEELTNDSEARHEQITYLDTVAENLLRQLWKEYEKPCQQQLVKIIRHVQNSTLWATWIWDSMQFPVGQLYGSRLHLGNYDQCLDLPWNEQPELRTQYCLAQVSLSEVDPEITKVDLYESVQKYIKRKTKHGLRYNNLVWGLCTPAVCKPESIAKFGQALLRASHLGQAAWANTTVEPAHCQLAGDQQEPRLGDRFVLSVIISLTIITLMCTFYVNARTPEKNIITDLAKAYDIKTNGHRLMNMNEQVRSVLGIRVLATYIVILGHQWLLKNLVGISNAGKLDKNMNSISVTFMWSAEMIIDIFFMLSGLFLMKNLIQKGVRVINPITAIAKRYFRFIFSIIFMILLQPLVFFGGESGPLVRMALQREVDSCDRNWWKTVLMIGNYVDTENICYPVLWSLMCDFHFTIVGIVIFWLYTRNRRVGLAIFVTGAVASVAIPTIYGYMYSSGAVITYDFRSSSNFRRYPIGEPAFTRSHLRAGPHFVGMAVGYMMALYNPTHYRKIISKKSSILSFAVIMALSTWLAVVAGGYHYRHYSALEGALFAVFRRNAFVTLVCALIIVCEYGTLPLVSDVLSWSAWVPFNKLSYGVYLIHLIIEFRMLSESRGPLRYDMYDDIITSFGLFAVSTIISLFLYLVLEAPMSNIVEMFFKRSPVPEEREKNGHVDATQEIDTKTEETADCGNNKLTKKYI